MRELLASANADHGVAGACILALFEEPDTEIALMRQKVGATLIAKGIAELTALRKAWTK